MSAVEKSFGLVLHRRQLEAGDHARGRRARCAAGRRSSNCGSPKSSLPPPSSSPTSARSSTPTVWLERPPMPVSSALPSSEARNVEQRAQVGEVEDRQPLLVGVAEDQPEALLLRLVRAEHLAEQLRAEVRDGRAHRARPGRSRRARGTRRESRSARTGCRDRSRACARRRRGVAGVGDARDVALDVGDEHGHAGGRELLGQSLQRLRLAGAGCARDQAVAGQHAQRHLHVRVPEELPLVHAAAEIDRRLRSWRTRPRSCSRSRRPSASA